MAEDKRTLRERAESWFRKHLGHVPSSTFLGEPDPTRLERRDLVPSPAVVKEPLLGLSLYGHIKAEDPRYAAVGGLIPIGVLGYYPCCDTDEPPCDLVAFRLSDGSATEFLLGRIDSARPRQLWRRRSENFPTPRGVRLLELQVELPCTRVPNEPHEWWSWCWEEEQSNG